MSDLTHALVDRALAVEWTPRTQHAVLRCAVDWAGCALGGLEHPLPGYVGGAHWIFGQSSDCTLVGQDRRASVLEACLFNGTASHVLDLDDVVVAFHGHPGVVIIPAVFALGEARHASGEQATRAIAVGYEAAALIGRLVGGRIGERGWHPTAILGCLAAAVAGSVMLGLSADETATAVALAATQAGGVRAMFGSHGKGIHAGRAASVGALSAALVAEGVRVPAAGLEGPVGLLQSAFGIDDDQQAAIAWLGSDANAEPAILNTAFKRHAACGATHSLIDAVGETVAENGIDPLDISRISARVHRSAMMAAGIPEAATPLQAKFSLAHLAALAAFTHPIGPEVLTDDSWTSDDVFALRKNVQLTVDESLEYKEATAAEATVTLKNGEIFAKFVDLPKGRRSNPISDDGLDQKFTSMGSRILGDDRCEAALRALWRLADFDDCGQAIVLLAQPEGK
jgi:2-methylcitrate dehydratase PrpD